MDINDLPLGINVQIFTLYLQASSDVNMESKADDRINTLKNGQVAENGKTDENGTSTSDEMTSRDYYFDSYAHFGKNSGLDVCICFLMENLALPLSQVFTKRCLKMRSEL